MTNFISNIIKKWKKLKQLLVCSIGLFCASIGCFCSGLISENSIIESTGVDISNFITSNSKTNYISIQVSPNDLEAKKAMPNTYYEYFYWKYIFRHSDFSFLSTVNGGKTHECYFDEIDVKDNISFVFCGNNSNNEFEGFYKHEVYDIKLMFKGVNQIQQDAINFFAISQTRANQILKNRGEHTDSEGNFSFEQYKKLLGTNTQIKIDGGQYLFTISNVFFETGQFHENVSQNFGEYVISYIYFPEFLKTESTYIFNTYDYQNIHKIKRMREIFKTANYSFNLSTFNLKNDNVNLMDVFNYNYVFGENIGNWPASLLILALSFGVLFASLYVLFLSEKIHNLKNLFFVVSSFLLPYVVLSIINIFIKIPLLFSYFSLFSYIIFLLMLVFVLTLILFKKRGDTIRMHL